MADNENDDNGGESSVSNSDDRESDRRRIAILGTCPISIEAALYGRYLGYEVILFGSDPVCSPWRNDGSPMMSPFRDNCTPLGLAALDAQSSDYDHPSPETTLSYQQWIEDYCIPLSRTDLVRRAFRLGAPVTSVSFNPIDETFQIVTSEEAETPAETFDYVIQPSDLGELGNLADRRQFEAANIDGFLELSGTQRAGKTLDFQNVMTAIVRAYCTIGERAEMNVYESLSRHKL